MQKLVLHLILMQEQLWGKLWNELIHNLKARLEYLAVFLNRKEKLTELVQ
jgi:hypothetical protein